MTSVVDVRQVSGLLEFVDEKLKDYNKVNLNSNPENPDSLSSYLLSGTKAIKEIILADFSQGNPNIESVNISEVTQINNAALREFNKDFNVINELMVNGKNVSEQHFEEIFLDYAQLQYGMYLLCYAPEELFEVTQTLPGVTYSCSTYADLNESQQLLLSSFATKIENPPNRDHLYVAAYYSPFTRILEKEDYANMGSHYVLGSLELGGEKDLFNKSNSPLLNRTSLVVAGQAGFLVGDGNTQQSLRQSVALKSGLRFYARNVFSIFPSAVLGVANNELNFGKGYNPLAEQSVYFGGNLDLNFNSFLFGNNENDLFSFVVSGRVENSFLGAPFYSAYSLLAGISVPL